MAQKTITTQKKTQLSIRASENEILLDQTEIRLSAKQWEVFCERLDEPAHVIPALRDLFSEPGAVK